jgi:hypothetical protein
VAIHWIRKRFCSEFCLDFINPRHHLSDLGSLENEDSERQSERPSVGISQKSSRIHHSIEIPQISHGEIKQSLQDWTQREIATNVGSPILSPQENRNPHSQSVVGLRGPIPRRWFTEAPRYRSASGFHTRHQTFCRFEFLTSYPIF